MYLATTVSFPGGLLLLILIIAEKCSRVSAWSFFQSSCGGCAKTIAGRKSNNGVFGIVAPERKYSARSTTRVAGSGQLLSESVNQRWSECQTGVDNMGQRSK